MERYLRMEYWAQLVRDFKDSEKAFGIEPYESERLAREVLRFVRYARISQWTLFVQQRGKDFDSMMEKLTDFDPKAIQRFLETEELWKATLEMGEQ